MIKSPKISNISGNAKIQKMKKFLSALSALSIFALLITVNIQTASASFTDLYKNNKNYKAIIYLQENDIIQGYPDGTFQPAQEINRAEFLKIILEGSNITLDKNEITLPFSDTRNEEWFTPYIKKAYTEGWIVGYIDGTFKPNQTISKVEALKILGEAQQWDLPQEIDQLPYADISASAWYAKYVVFAHTNDYLEGTEELFSPNDLMTRANISEIIYRTLIAETSEDQTQDTLSNEEIEAEYSADNTAETDDTDEEELLFTPHSYEEISRTFFDNIALDGVLPNTFYKNEVYIIEGELTLGGSDKITVFLDTNDDDDTDYLLFTGDLENNRFEIPIYFKNSGNYHIGIILGTSGNTKLADISILPSLPEPTSQKEPEKELQSLNINYKNDTTFAEFSAPSSLLKILTLKQNSKSVQYISRQNLDTIPVSYSDFEDFSEGTVTYYTETAELDTIKPVKISSDYSKSSEKTFKAVQHTYDNISEDEISANPPDTLSGNSEKILFSGTVNTDTQTNAYVIKPDGFVDSVTLSTTDTTSDYFGTEIIEDGDNFRFEYTIEDEGRFIVEILNKSGSPTINHPVYVGNIIPLIPDYFDLNERFFFSGNFNLNTLREDLLEEINESRSNHGLSEVKMDTDLNNLAQSHSDDMVEDNFFGHINSENQTPNDRRIEAGISTSVSENIAKDISVKFAHLGLMRSGTHRENILDPNWEVIGIGISLDDGYIYITEEFSTEKISENDLENYKDELLSRIISERNSNNLPLLKYSNDIESACKYLNDLVIIDEETITENDLIKALNLYDIGGTSQYVGRTYNTWPDILFSILEEENSIINDDWRSIGIDIQLDKIGIIHTSFMLNK